MDNREEDGDQLTIIGVEANGRVELRGVAGIRLVEIKCAAGKGVEEGPKPVCEPNQPTVGTGPEGDVSAPGASPK